MAALLFLVARFPTVSLTIVYLVAGTGIVLALTTLVMNSQVFQSTNNAVLALPCLALMLVGGAGNGSVIAIVWTSLGYLLGEAALLIGSQLVGAEFAPSYAATAAFIIVLVVRTFDGMSRRQHTRRNTGLHAASQQSRELAIRHEYELRATARLHDTALSHLVAISASGSGPVDERLRAGIRQDLGLIIGRDWATELTNPQNAHANATATAGARPTDPAPTPTRPCGTRSSPHATPHSRCASRATSTCCARSTRPAPARSMRRSRSASSTSPATRGSPRSRSRWASAAAR